MASLGRHTAVKGKLKLGQGRAVRCRQGKVQVACHAGARGTCGSGQDKGGQEGMWFRCMQYSGQGRGRAGRAWQGRAVQGKKGEDRGGHGQAGSGGIGQGRVAGRPGRGEQGRAGGSGARLDFALP